MLQRALMIAFARGVGGGLSLAAVPYILADGSWSLRAMGGGWRGAKNLGEDAGDAWRYYREMRQHRMEPRKSPVPGQSWQPEQDGYQVE